MNVQSLVFFAWLVMTPSATTADSQTAPIQSHTLPRIGQAVRSPEVQPDGRVTFRFRAPNAKDVLLIRENAPKLALRKDDRGIWSATTDPIAPDFYCYRFVVDGVALADPANSMSISVATGGFESILHVPGAASLSWERNDTSHGILHCHTYQSAAIGDTREFWVYTPPGYDASLRKTYPVLYLLHGVMDDASAWTTAGRAHIILDNMIARHKARPMIMVMPLGYGFPNVPDRLAEQFGDPSSQKKILDVFSHSLIDEVIPNVERAYRVKKDRSSRAIAGLSMGGAQALYIGLNHQDRFAWVGSFSGAFVMYGERLEEWFPELTLSANPRLHLLWMACGTEDFLLGVNHKCTEWLKSKDVQFTAIETRGTHAWQVWRRNLTEFTPLLFRGRRSSRAAGRTN